MDISGWMKRAEEGDIEAMVRMVHYLVWEDNNEGQYDSTIRSKILDYISKAVEGKDETAIFLLGRMYYEGKVVRRSYKKAAELFDQAAAEGSIAASCYLGKCYLEGRGVKANHEKAFMYFSKSALLGNTISMIHLGDMFMDGLYVERDDHAAISVYIKVLKSVGTVESYDDEIVYSDACIRLARAFTNGIGGLDRNLINAQHFYSEAITWLEKRIKRGESKAEEYFRTLMDEYLQVLQELKEK